MGTTRTAPTNHYQPLLYITTSVASRSADPISRIGAVKLFAIPALACGHFASDELVGCIRSAPRSSETTSQSERSSVARLTQSHFRFAERTFLWLIFHIPHGLYYRFLGRRAAAAAAGLVALLLSIGCSASSAEAHCFRRQPLLSRDAYGR